MTEKKYSIVEINRMRIALCWINTPFNSGYYAEELDRKIEDQLRTHIQNGTSPEELEKASQEYVASMQNFTQRMR